MPGMKVGLAFVAGAVLAGPVAVAVVSFRLILANRMSIMPDPSNKVNQTGPCHTASCSTSYAHMDVDPHEAGALPIVELADLVADAIPSTGFDDMKWDYLSESPLIIWETGGVNQTGESPYREGLVRVRVNGKASSVLHQKREELAWTLTLGSDAPAKFGPKWIRIEAGIGSGQCFGTVYDDCTFTPSDMLAGNLLKEKLCSSEYANGGPRSVYAVSQHGGPKLLLVYQVSEGSGGATSSVEIRPLSDRARFCPSFNTP